MRLLGGSAAHPAGGYHPVVEDDFRQLTFVESQVQLRLPAAARLVDLSGPNEAVVTLMALNVTLPEVRESLRDLEVRDVVGAPGWVFVRIAGLAPGFDVALITTGENVQALN